MVIHMEYLAWKWHEGQFRRGPGKMPYREHPKAVVEMLRRWGFNNAEDPLTLAVAWGHDLLEDTKIPESEFDFGGGQQALAGVRMLTFRPERRMTDEEYDRAKADYIRQIAEKAPAEIVVVKIADRLCNTLDFLKSDSKHAMKYLEKGAALFTRLDNDSTIKHRGAIRNTYERIKIMINGKYAIKTVLGDITKLHVDAIVNAANEMMLGGGGVDGAIHRAAGPELYQECLAVEEVRPGVRCPTGEARITGGGELPARHVIHTVGPVYRDGRHGEAEKLAACYRNSLELAAEKGLTTIAFPSISTGVYGYPAEEAAPIAIREVKEFLMTHPDMEVTFCLFNGPRDRIDMKALYDRLLSVR